MRNRYYDEELGRFIQMDPIGLNAGDVNCYRYCGNDGVLSIDISGRESVACEVAEAEGLLSTILDAFGPVGKRVSKAKKLYAGANSVALAAHLRYGKSVVCGEGYDVSDGIEDALGIINPIWGLAYSEFKAIDDEYGLHPEDFEPNIDWENMRQSYCNEGMCADLSDDPSFVGKCWKDTP